MDKMDVIVFPKLPENILAGEMEYLDFQSVDFNEFKSLFELCKKRDFTMTILNIVDEEEKEIIDKSANISYIGDK